MDDHLFTIKKYEDVDFDQYDSLVSENEVMPFATGK